MENNNGDPFRSGNTAAMTTLSECLDLASQHGYNEGFQVQGNALYAPSKDNNYTPTDVHVINFYRFEGASNPDDMSILYIIETTDGIKGTLIDAYGTYADSEINAFILSVHDFHKKTDQ